MYGIVVILGKPKSRGVVRLPRATRPAPALVDPRYFIAREDLDTLVRGVKRARASRRDGAARHWGNLELMPGRWVGSDQQLGDWIRKNVMTTYHFSGTCKMGTGGDAVVDPELRVRGVARPARRRRVDHPVGAGVGDERALDDDRLARRRAVARRRRR